MKLRYAWSMLLLLILHAEVNALSTDQDKPFEVEADSAIVDENLGSTIYRGDVSIIQGSLKILADEIEIITIGGDVVQIIARTDENSDRLAHLEQQPDHKERVFADARSINYYIQEQRVNLTGEALLRQKGDEFTGEIVYYDVGQGIIHLKSGSESERIKIKYNTAK